MRSFFEPIHFNATVEQLEEALPFTKGKWKHFDMPLFDMKDLKPGSIGKFELGPAATSAFPMNNYLKDKL